MRNRYLAYTNLDPATSAGNRLRVIFMQRFLLYFLIIMSVSSPLAAAGEEDAQLARLYACVQQADQQDMKTLFLKVPEGDREDALSSIERCNHQNYAVKKQAIQALLNGYVIDEDDCAEGAFFAGIILYSLFFCGGD